MEVDFDSNVTELYSAIQHSEWDKAILIAKEFPNQAKTWVVRRYQNGEIMWKFLPLHSASAKNPPTSLISALISSYQEGAERKDDQGMLPIHYACGNQASTDIIRLLLLANPMGASTADPNGMYPLHYLAQWGPSSISALQTLVLADQKAILSKDVENFTPLDLAIQGEYSLRDEVIRVLRQHQESKFQRVEKLHHDSETMPILSPLNKTNDAVRKMQEAVASCEKARNTYIRGGDLNGESREDDHQKLENRTDYSYREEFMDYDEFQISIDAGKKKVNEMKLEVEQLQSLAVKESEEAAKRIAAEKNKMQEELSEMKLTLVKKKDELDAAKHELAEKERLSKSTELSLEDKENQLNAAMKQNEDLRKKLETVRKQIAIFRMKSNSLDDHLETISKSIQTMMKEQEEIMKVSTAHEKYVHAANERRQTKMQRLIDQEMSISRSYLEKHRHSNLGSEEGVNLALEKQKLLMSNISTIVSERY